VVQIYSIKVQYEPDIVKLDKLQYYIRGLSGYLIVRNVNMDEKGIEKKK